MHKGKFVVYTRLKRKGTKWDWISDPISKKKARKMVKVYKESPSSKGSLFMVKKVK
jgi:hypothetical protein